MHAVKKENIFHLKQNKNFLKIKKLKYPNISMSSFSFLGGHINGPRKEFRKNYFWFQNRDKNVNCFFS